MKTQPPKNLHPLLPPSDEASIRVRIRLRNKERTYLCDWFGPEEHAYLIYNNIIEDFSVSPVDFDTLALAEVEAEKGNEVIRLRFNPETFLFKSVI